MKGITKAIMRTPHMVTSKVGMSKKSSDPEFDEYARKFTTMESAAEKLLKDAKLFSEGTLALLMAEENWAIHFSNIFHPIAGEFDLIGRHPDSADTVRNVTIYQTQMEELRAAVAPELELIESRIVAPTRELQTIMKQIRKNITKRDHKLTDYDRFNNSLTKLRDKKEKSLSDEKNLFKLEQDYEQALNDYELYNGNMKQDLPQFMVLSTQFIDPLFHSFFYMQLNVFYIMVEKFQAFASGKMELLAAGAQIEEAYEAARTDAREQIDGLTITHRIASTAKMMAGRQTSGSSSLSRAGTTASVSTLSRAGTTASTLSRAGTTVPSFKKAPPPPPPSMSAAPPPYSPSAGSGAATLAATKRAPPAPPALKPKPPPPKPKPAAVYVVALYDFDAQADGDLSFKTGDRIEIVQKTDSAEDWWTGKVSGMQGVFPGNYVQET